MNNHTEWVRVDLIKNDDCRWNVVILWESDGRWMSIEDEVGPARSAAAALDMVASLVDDLVDCPFPALQTQLLPRGWRPDSQWGK